jgi:hypothetical protein
VGFFLGYKSDANFLFIYVSVRRAYNKNVAFMFRITLLHLGDYNITYLQMRTNADCGAFRSQNPLSTVVNYGSYDLRVILRIVMQIL